MSPVDGAGSSNLNLPVDRAVTEGRVPDRASEGIPELHEVGCPPELRERIELLMSRYPDDNPAQTTARLLGTASGTLDDPTRLTGVGVVQPLEAFTRPLRPGKDGQADLASIRESMQEWGGVTPRQRAAVIEGGEETIIEPYKKLIDDYYKSLATKATERCGNDE